MNTKWTGKNLEEAVNRYNAMVKGLAIAAPQIASVLDGARITNDKVDKRTMDKVRAIIECNMPKETWCRCRLSREYTYTLYVVADINSHVSEYSVEYGEVSIPVAEKNEHAWRKLDAKVPGCVTVESVTSALNAVETAEKAESIAHDITMQAEQAAGLFIHR